MAAKKVEEMVLVVCRKHPEVSRRLPPPPPAATACRRSCAPTAAAAACPLLLTQGCPEKVLAEELPDVPVEDRAVAINNLLQAHKLQVRRALPAGRLHRCRAAPPCRSSCPCRPRCCR